MRVRAGSPQRCGVEGLVSRLQVMNRHLFDDDDLAQLVASITEQSGEIPADDVALVAISRELVEPTPLA